MAKSASKKAVTKGGKKRRKSRKESYATVGELIVKAVSASKERRGVSLAAVKKALSAGGYDVEKNNSRVKIAVKNLVANGTLVQTKGTGASGSFKINKADTKAKKPATKVKKPKKAVTRKKSPKKVKKPAAKKRAAKKAVKRPKKKAKKRAAPKKAAARRVAKPRAAKRKKAAPRKKYR